MLFLSFRVIQYLTLMLQNYRVASSLTKTNFMFSEFYILIGLVAFVIQVIVLICFFIACSNIGKIKKAVETMPVDKYSMYQKFLAFGHAEKARESLEDYTWETIKV